MATAENTTAKTEPAGYDRLLNIAASAVTVAAGVLGVFGIGTGIATALLRNAPEAMLTSACTAGLAVLAGLASALVRTGATVRGSSWAVRAGLLGAGLLAVQMWVLTGRSYQRNGARTASSGWSWYVFIAGIGIVTTGAIVWVVLRSQLRLRTGLALVGVFLFGSAVLATVVLATAALRTSARPTIAADVAPSSEPAGYITLTGTVTAQGLSNDERYEIVTHLLTGPATTDGAEELYRAYVGPDRDGVVSYTFTVSFARHTARPWLGVTARVVGEGTAGAEPVSNCGVGTERGVSCTLIRVPEAVPPTGPAAPS